MELSGRALIGAEVGAKLGVRDIDDSALKSYRYELGGLPQLHAILTSLRVIFIPTEKSMWPSSRLLGQITRSGRVVVHRNRV
jgi:hypothetical protein